MIDPYLPGDLTNLTNAANTACVPTTMTPTSPFCNSTTSTMAYADGIFLNLEWCEFQMYVSGATPPASCHYYLNSSGGQVMPAAQQSKCVTSTANPMPPFDECASTDALPGTLATALDAIITINASRAAVVPTKLPLIRITIGLKAGIYVPLTYILNTSPNVLHYQDVVVPLNIMNSGQQYCGRLPDPWSNAYIAAYNSALDELYRFINTYRGGALKNTIRIIKVAPFGVNSAELNMGGRMGGVMVGSDTGTPTQNQGLTMSCPSSSGAQEWLDEYNTNVYNSTAHSYDCNSYVSIIQASQCVLGMALGHMHATLYNNNVSIIDLAINQSNGNIYPDLECGYDGSGSCAVTTDLGNQWSQLNFFQTINGVFTSGTPVNSAQSYGFHNHATDGTYKPLTHSNLLIEWTGLTINPSHPDQNFFNDGSNTLNANAQLTCALNNTSVSHPASFMLDSSGVPYTPTPSVGFGTLNAWQTLNNKQSGFCTTFLNGINEYDAILKSGYQNPATGLSNGQLLELQTDALFTKPLKLRPVHQHRECFTTT